MTVRLHQHGELEITLGGQRRYCIEPWSAGLGVFSVKDNVRRRVSLPSFTLISAEPEIAANADARRFIAEIPEQVREAVRPFTGFGQAALLHWAATGKAACDLLLANPLLLWLAAVAFYEGVISGKEIPQLFGLRQRRILGAVLKSEASNAQLKLLRKIRTDRASLSEGRALLNMLIDRELATLLRHASMLPVSLLGLFYRLPSLAQAEIIPLLAAWAEKTTLDNFIIDYSMNRHFLGPGC